MTDSISPPPLLKSSDVPAWSDEADVIVVGLGISGVSAAIEAREAGADVLAVERAGAGGGSSALSGGQIYLGGGTPVQQACGFQDSPEEMLKYLMLVTPAPDLEKLRLYCYESVSHFHWLEAHGVPFERSYFKGKDALHMSTECLAWTGNEQIWPFREQAQPAPRGHKVAAEGDGGGFKGMQMLLQSAQQLGVRMATNTAVTALVQDTQGRIVGVRVRLFDQVSYFKARSGVILAAGGFIMNDAMLAHYIPALPRDFHKHGNPYDDGLGIRLGLSAGAATSCMDNFFVNSCFYPPGDLLKGILVNSHGKRFVSEDSYHGRTAIFSLEQPGGEVYLILDSEIFAYPEYKHMNHTLVDGWDSVAEMEAGLRLPEGSLQGTLQAYNASAAAGQDPEFHKLPKWLKPLTTPPYAAFDLSVGRATYIGFTLGGLQTSSDGEVLTEDHKKLAGLYAAGACASNILQDGRGYSTGMSLGEGSFFGRRAGGRAAASRL